MIDIENEIYSAVATALRGQYATIDISSTPPAAPSSFPYVSFYEADNRTDEFKTDSSLGEFGILMYEVSVFSNKIGGKKAEARAIMAIIDGVMRGYNFVRTEMSPVDNRDDYTVYRIVARYTGETDGTNMYQYMS